MVEDKIIGEEPRISKIFKTIKNIIIIIIEIVLVLIILFNLWNFINRTVLNKESANIFGYKAYTIVSGSMVPTIKIDDFILIKNVDPKTLKIDDIITFVKEDSIITHRIVDINEDEGKLFFKTKGDNNNTEDIGNVEEDMIKGKYIYTIPIIGKISSFMKTLSGKIALIALPIILILIEYLKSANKKYQSEQRYIKRLKYNADIEKKE